MRETRLARESVPGDVIPPDAEVSLPASGEPLVRQDENAAMFPAVGGDILDAPQTFAHASTIHFAPLDETTPAPAGRQRLVCVNHGERAAFAEVLYLPF